MRRVLKRAILAVLLIGLNAVTLVTPLLPASPLHPQVTPFDDPAEAGGGFMPSEQFYGRELYRLYLHDTATRLNIPQLTGMSDDAFACLIAAKILTEEATVYSDQQPIGLVRQYATIPPALAGHSLRLWMEDALYDGEISWGPGNIAYPNAVAGLRWWRTHAALYGHRLSDVHTGYYAAGRGDPLSASLLGQTQETGLLWEMQTGQGAVEILALETLHSAYRARRYYALHGHPDHPLSAYTIAMGIEGYRLPAETLYELRSWTSKGYYYDWVRMMDNTSRLLGLRLSVPADYLPFTPQEQALLDTLPRG